MSTKDLDRLLLRITALQTQYNRNYYAKHYQGLGMNEVHTLVLIQRHQDINVKGLSEVLDVSKGCITKITKRLMDEGYLLGYHKAHNQKEKYFTLQPSALPILEKHEEFHLDQSVHDAALLAAFNEQEQAVIFAFLEKLEQDLETRE
ncbi:MAG: MarR family winged helix-turn-helix transcriptional regulator [Erysipelotrichaceae bacterium]